MINQALLQENQLIREFVGQKIEFGIGKLVANRPHGEETLNRSVEISSRGVFLWGW